MLACVLRRSRIDGAKNAAAVIKLLVQRLRRAWPDMRIIVRGDSGFCRQRLLRWCERSGVSYIVGLARNARLEAPVQYAEAMLADEYERSGTKQRLIDEFAYAADSWDIERRVITRLEHGSQGNNPRFVVTNLEGDAVQLYERLYCARGEAENRIKEAQLDLFGTRASCHRFAANQLRLLLAALAYTLMQRLRELALKGSELERATRGHDPRAAAQDRRGHRAQHAPRARAAGLASSAARACSSAPPRPLRPLMLHPVLRTGRAVFPHPALGQGLTRSPTGSSAVRALRRTSPSTSCRYSSGNRDVPRLFTLCFPRSHWRSRCRACRSMARYAGLTGPRQK